MPQMQHSTRQPATDSEWMLYRVLQKANLIQYFEMFVAQGGDDVYQLVEAGEEEFLEIMALVGMAGKPLHVRRLQRALHEWLTNPASFKSTDDVCPLNCHPAKGSILASVPHAVSMASCRYWMQSGVSGSHKTPVDGSIQCGRLEINGVDGCYGKSLLSPGLGNSLDADVGLASDREVNVSPSPSMSSVGNTSEFFLSENHMKTLETGAAELAKTLPLFAPRPLNVKKPVDKEIEEILNYPDDYPNRIEVLRKYSAIYGRFDSRRKTDKQMNLHEMCINEAAAQLCRHRPSLLTRREELFSLARNVVRDCGLQFSKNHSRAHDGDAPLDSSPCRKQLKLESYPCEPSPSQFSGSRTCFSTSMSTQFLESLDHIEPLAVQAVGSVAPSANDDGGEEPSTKGGSLVDEGLRFAQQYGLGEFEEKLREMKRETLETTSKTAAEDLDDDEGAGEGTNNSTCAGEKNFAAVSEQCSS